MVEDNIEMSFNYTVGVIGGGIAGSTVALRLSELGIKVALLEKGKSLVNGPPFCHLHAGGNLYREIPDHECITLLKESIDCVQMYPMSMDCRPTLIAVPQRDAASPLDLLPRLKKIQAAYKNLVQEDARNEVLGKSEHYFKLYDRVEVEILAQRNVEGQPQNTDDWMASAAKVMDLDTLKFPLVMVAEYGWNIFRVASAVTLALDANENCEVITEAEVTQIEEGENWNITFNKNGKKQEIQVDFLVNACGFKTGTIDNMLDIKQNRMVEFKAAYISHWNKGTEYLPEIIFHGERGTKNGMAQLTPYPDGYYQIHGMTNEITLFKNGLKENNTNNSQPELNPSFLDKINKGWDKKEIKERTEKSMEHISYFIPEFNSAEVGGVPLFGVQQIPGKNPDLRAAGVSFPRKNYACCEIVKASSSLAVANEILNQLIKENHITENKFPEFYFPSLNNLKENKIQELANELCEERNYPVPMASLIQNKIDVKIPVIKY